MNPDRDAWTTYAERHGLLRDQDPTDRRATVGRPDGAGLLSRRDPAPNKYHAMPVHVDGVRFASKKEAARFLELQLWQKAGQIAELACQPVFPIHVMELWRPGPIAITTIGRFTADFSYLNLTTGEYVVEDVKSTATKTTAYRIRKRLVEAIHGLTITEV